MQHLFTSAWPFPALAAQEQRTWVAAGASCPEGGVDKLTMTGDDWNPIENGRFGDGKHGGLSIGFAQKKDGRTGRTQTQRVHHGCHVASP